MTICIYKLTSRTQLQQYCQKVILDIFPSTAAKWMRSADSLTVDGCRVELSRDRINIGLYKPHERRFQPYGESISVLEIVSGGV